MFGETTTADGMLYLLRDNPTLMPPAPPGPTGLTAAMEHRSRDEVHACLRCGKRAHCAIIAATTLGNRWLDLCHPCVHWLQTKAPEPLFPGRPA